MTKTKEKIMKGKGYSSLKVALKSGINIKTSLMKLPNNDYGYITLPRLHCTLMYDKRDPLIEFRKDNSSHIADVIGVGILGKAVVLHIVSSDIQKRFKELLEAGFEHSFDSLKLHVSIIYEEDKSRLEKIYEEVKVLWNKGIIPKQIELYKETWEECE